jgi:RND family efflux transporter MFP subunit
MTPGSGDSQRSVPLHATIMKKSPLLALLLCCILCAGSYAQDAPPPAETVAADKPLTIEPAILTIIDQADIPARDAGVLEKLNFTEGLNVRQGDLLAELDFREQEMLRGKARVEVELAAAKAASNVQLDFAKVSHEIAKADEARALESERKFAKSVSKTELDQLRLAVEKTRFEITHAEEEQTLAKLTQNLKEQELELASYKLALRRIIAPFDGAVAQRYRRVGEWVQPGDKVLRLIRTDRLRIEAFVALKFLPPEATSCVARWIVTLPDMKEQTYAAKITFISPEANPVNGQVRLWAEIDNRDGTLRAGQVGRLEILTAK